MSNETWKETVFMLKSGRMYIETIGIHSVSVTAQEGNAIKYEIFDEQDALEMHNLMARINRDIERVIKLLGVREVRVIKKTVTTTYEESKGWGEK